MFETLATRPLSERKALQAKHSTHTLPLQALCDATYTSPDGHTMIVDLIATDEAETQAILSDIDEERDTRLIWHAYRDQSGVPGTWLWTPRQLEDARIDSTRLTDEENEFADDADRHRPIGIHIHDDPRVSILMLGLRLNKPDAEVQERLRREGLDDTLPENYRTEQGELNLLRNWLPAAKTQPTSAEKALRFSRKKRR